MHMYGEYIMCKAHKWISITGTDNNKIKVFNLLPPVKQTHSKGQSLLLPQTSVIASERRCPT